MDNKKIKKVIAIDDDQVNNIIFEKLSEFGSFAEEVVCFISAVDGLDYLQQIKNNQETAPDIIFLDIRMPIVNGWEFLERFNEFRNPHFKDTHIYMLTSSADQSDVNKARNIAIVNDYIVKPLTLDILAELKEKYLSVEARG